MPCTHQLAHARQQDTCHLCGFDLRGGSDWRIVRLPSVERGCNAKTNFGRSYAKQADKLAAKHGKKYGVYRCHHCGGTHLTTKLDKSENYAPLIHISEPKGKLSHPAAK